MRLRWKPWKSARREVLPCPGGRDESQLEPGGKLIPKTSRQPGSDAVKFVPGIIQPNPEMKFFVVVIRVNDRDKKRNKRTLEARLHQPDQAVSLPSVTTCRAVTGAEQSVDGFTT